MKLFRTKPLSAFQETHEDLKRVLHATDLVLLGIGAIIGAGVFVLTGIAAATEAGPAIVISYLIAGIACTFTALAYAELASSIGGSGSAYAYAYAGLGELIAWFIGWNLILEYGLSTATIAVGWSGYVQNALQSMGMHPPASLFTGPFRGGIINLPAAVIVCLLTVLLCVGTKESARFNNFIVFVKLLAIAVFLIVGIFDINPVNWADFTPFGWSGVVNGAALIFFAYIGFDAVATAADEAVNPQRDLPIGIIVSLFVCTLLYILVSGVLTAIVPYTTLNVDSPVSHALLELNHHFTAGVVAAGAIAGLTTTMLVMFFGLTRVFYAISKDGLLPKAFSKVNRKTRTPIFVIVFNGILIALAAGVIPIHDLAEMVNIGTLAAFTVVCLGVPILRIRQPQLERPFKIPFYPVSPILGALCCIGLIFHLPFATMVRFVVWTAIGFVIYLGYSQSHSLLNKKRRQ